MPTPLETVGKYRVVRKLGQGGMGCVYEAVDDKIKNHVAVKVLNTQHAANVQVIMRFFNEAQIANSIAHPGIVKIHDHGFLPSGEAFLTMELLRGTSLRDRIAEGCSETDAIRWGRQIASALVAVHDIGIVHRDLKPDNLMLVFDPDIDGGERIKVLDFGIARITRPEEFGDALQQTGTGMVLGTPSYMAPEQCMGAKNVDAKADVYALGTILYEVLTGAAPFSRQSDRPGTQSGEPSPSVVEILYQQINKTPRLLSECREGLLPGLVGLIHQMLQKAAPARPSMREVLHELEALAGAASTERSHRASQSPRRIVSTQIGGSEASPVWAKRRSLLGGLGGTAGLAAVLLIVVVYWPHSPVSRLQPEPDGEKLPVPNSSAAPPPGSEASVAVVSEPARRFHSIPDEKPRRAHPSRTAVVRKPAPAAARPVDPQALLRHAQALFDEQQYPSVITTARQVMPQAAALSLDDLQMAWSLIGRSACRLDDLPLAAQAHRALASGSHHQGLVIEACKQRKQTCKDGAQDALCRSLQPPLPSDLRPFRSP